MIVIVDYGMGNLKSIANMLKKIGLDSLITSDAEQIAQASKLILPGVGAFDQGMKNLESSGLRPCLEQKVNEQQTPVLGICLGMQLLSRSSEEGKLPGLGWIEADTQRFNFDSQARLKIPHMGWNTIQVKRSNALLKDSEKEQRFYFVHSYHLVCDQPEDILAETHYGYPFAAAVGHDNVFGVQFHPEKSLRFGMEVLRHFAELNHA